MFRHFILLLIFLFSACQDTKPRAKGGSNEIIVISSKGDKSAIESILSTILSDTLFTPQPEPYFKIIWVDLDSTEMFKIFLHS